MLSYAKFHTVSNKISRTFVLYALALAYKRSRARDHTCHASTTLSALGRGPWQGKVGQRKLQRSLQFTTSLTGHPSDPIFKKYDVSKDQLSECSTQCVYNFGLRDRVHHAFTGLDDLLPVVRAIQKVGDRSVHIGRTLGLPQDRRDEPELCRYHSQDRQAIAVIDSWLRGNFNRGSRPYALHSEEKYRCPSWWNLVWVVAHSTGGNNPAHALVIAQSYKGIDMHQYT